MPSRRGGSPPMPDEQKQQSEPKWYAATYRGTAEMTCWVQADSPTDARRAAEDVEYEDMTDVEFVKGRPYTMKVKPAPEYRPPEEWERNR